MKKYKTGGYEKLIEEVEIARETEKCVYIKDRFGHGNEKISREAKRGSYANYFDTIGEAKEFYKDLFNGKIRHYEQQIKAFKAKLKELEQY